MLTSTTKSKPSGNNQGMIEVRRRVGRSAWVISIPRLSPRGTGEDAGASREDVPAHVDYRELQVGECFLQLASFGTHMEDKSSDRVRLDTKNDGIVARDVLRREYCTRDAIDLQ